MRTCPKLFLAVISINIIFLASCTKKATDAPVQLDTSLLTKYDWLITPEPSKNYTTEYRNGNYYLDEILITDTIRLSYFTDSTYRSQMTSTEVYTASTTPYVGIPWGDYLPHGFRNDVGTFSFSKADSILSEIKIYPPFTFPPIERKVLLLNNDSLKLYSVTEGIRTYYAVP